MRHLQRTRLPADGLRTLYRRTVLQRCLASVSGAPGASAATPTATDPRSNDDGSSKAQPRLPPRALMDALSAYSALTVAQFPGAGRGLLASTDISYGETILTEQPLLCCQSPGMADQVCYGCLSVLGTHNLHITSPLSGRHFCSDACMGACEARWHAMESLAMAGPPIQEQPSASSNSASSGANAAPNALAAFEAMCQHYGERFPLMAARLAFARLTRAVTQHANGETASSAALQSGASSSQGPAQQQGQGPVQAKGQGQGEVGSASTAAAGATGASQPSPSSPSSDSSTGGGGAVAAQHAQGQRPIIVGDPATDLGFLCFANVPKPYPEPWVQLYLLLRQAMEAAVQEASRQLLLQQQPSTPPQQQQQLAQRAAALQAELQQLDLDWFVSVLARLHINVFRVGCLVPPTPSSLGSGVGAGLMPGVMSSGSAAYLVASLFNHSCEPNVEVVFRRNDSTAAFVAARDIDKGEQLFVSYMDETMPLHARQQHLTFAYGFKCRCQRCVEDEQDAAA